MIVFSVIAGIVLWFLFPRFAIAVLAGMWFAETSFYWLLLFVPIAIGGLWIDVVVLVTVGSGIDG